MEEIDINPDFEAALSEMEHCSDACLFITGKAGTGKSTLLRYFRTQTRQNIVVLAPTGIAALHIGGQTIHSFFGFPPRPLDNSHLQQRKYRRVFQALQAIVIDEISMVRADWMDAIDTFLRNNANDPQRPFGGVRLLVMGDMFQLPPVIGSAEEATFLQKKYDSPYFFSAKVFRHFPIRMIELREVYRQNDIRFVRLLDAIRTNQMDAEDLEALNTRYRPKQQDSQPRILLSARNATAEAINQQRLQDLAGERFSYVAQITGNVPVLPADTPLHLKIGAQVVFLKNDPKRRFVNGTIGQVVHLDVDQVQVAIPISKDQHKIIDVERHEWELHHHQYIAQENSIQTQLVGAFLQYPLRLAWAMTIHKSQGQTFQRVFIDMDKGAFEFGQTYVALSRCKTLKGIRLQRPLLPTDVRVDERVVDFYQQHS